MKTISIFTGPINKNWYPASYSAGNKENPKMRILVDQFKIVLKDHEFITPGDFYTDMASVPRILAGIFPPSGVDDLAFVVHDYLCWKKIVSYQDAAETMKFIQLKLGASKFRANCMSFAVKWFGPKW